MSVIQNIGTEQSLPAISWGAKTPELSSQQTKDTTSGAGNIGQEYVVNLSGEAVDLGQLQEMKSLLHEEARNIRAADRSMDQISDYIDQMKNSLNTIVKTFPPYPPGSEERVRLLKSYNAFRKLIDQLSFNPEDKAERIITPAPDIASETGMSAPAIGNGVYGVQAADTAP